MALDSIIPLVDKMREDQLLPAICFSDDRQACELLAIRLADELERRERVRVLSYIVLIMKFRSSWKLMSSGTTTLSRTKRSY